MAIQILIWNGDQRAPIEAGVRLELVVDSVPRATAVTDDEGRATFEAELGAGEAAVVRTIS